MNIFVGNLSLETTEEELRKEFAVFGEVVSVTVMNDKYIGSGQLRGYGYVNMSSKSEGTNAIASLHGKNLYNNVINVVEALPLSSTDGWSPDIKSGNHLFKIRKRKHAAY